jgi:GT2 family glycosyltransferase
VGAVTAGMAERVDKTGERLIAASLVIPTRNRPELLKDTLISILSDSRVPAEIIIVDQSDLPNREICRMAESTGVEIRYIHSAAVGLSRAKNAGMASATHEILVFTDDDMRTGPGWFASITAALQNAGSQAAVTGRVLPGESEKPGGFVPSTVLDESPAVYSGRLQRDVLASGNMAIHRSLLFRLGGFDERLGPGTRLPAAEDNDLGFRLLESGGRIHYVPEALLYHRAWRSSSEYLPMRWGYGLGKGGFYRKHLHRSDGHMFRRLLRDIGNRLLRLPVRLMKNPRRAIGDVVYTCGVIAGLARWRWDMPARSSVTGLGSPEPQAAITVAISTVGRSMELARCLDALMAGATLPSEIIVVDQSNSSEIAELLAAYRRPDVAVVHLRQARLGLSAGRNAALRASGQKIIAITDDDCVPGEHWLSTIQQAFSSANPPDAVTGRVLPLGPERPGTWAVSTRSSTEAREYRGYAVPWHVGTGGNFAVTRDWLNRAGGYDERLGAGSAGLAGEDMDLFFRLLRGGASIRFEPAAVVYHERQDASRRRASRSSYGHGVGAFCGLAARRGDWAALPLLIRWLVLRGKIALKGVLRGNWQTVREERLVLQGTCVGLWFGLSVKPGSR